MSERIIEVITVSEQTWENNFLFFEKSYFVQISHENQSFQKQQTGSL